MKDKDKEAYDTWLISLGTNKSERYNFISPQSAWQAACEYKQKEIDDLLKQLKHEHDLYKKHLKVYEDENKKLRLVVDHYAQADDVGAYARIILRELKND